MSDKTCGTCGRGYPAVMCSAKYPVGEVMCHDESCDKWIERTDSLEQVALDAAKKHCCYCDYWGGTKREPVCDPCFADRLRALGVEVSQ